MEEPVSLVSADLVSPTFASNMRSNVFSRQKATYHEQHKRRLRQLCERPYLKDQPKYPGVPIHRGGTQTQYRWEEIDAVVDRLYRLPQRWVTHLELRQSKVAQGHAGSQGQQRSRSASAGHVTSRPLMTSRPVTSLDKVKAREEGIDVSGYKYDIGRNSKKLVRKSSSKDFDNETQDNKVTEDKGSEDTKDNSRFKTPDRCKKSEFTIFKDNELNITNDVKNRVGVKSENKPKQLRFMERVIYTEEPDGSLKKTNSKQNFYNDTNNEHYSDFARTTTRSGSPDVRRTTTAQRCKSAAPQQIRRSVTTRCKSAPQRITTEKSNLSYKEYRERMRNPFPFHPLATEPSLTKIFGPPLRTMVDLEPPMKFGYSRRQSVDSDESSSSDEGKGRSEPHRSASDSDRVLSSVMSLLQTISSNNGRLRPSSSMMAYRGKFCQD